MNIKTLIASAVAVGLLAACREVERKTELQGALVGATRTAGPGDTVMEFKATKPLPNMVGKADIFGRTTDAGRTSLRYMGSRGAQAVFERSDVVVETNATTMNQTPLLVPEYSHARMDGTIGSQAVSARASSTSYTLVGPRPTFTYATAGKLIYIGLSAGQSTSIEGRKLTVLRVEPASVEYRVD